MLQTVSKCCYAIVLLYLPRFHGFESCFKEAVQRRYRRLCFSVLFPLLPNGAFHPRRSRTSRVQCEAF